jgi:hypothetical protein
MTASVGLVLNQAAGTGHDLMETLRIIDALARGFGERLEVDLRPVRDHAAARRAARELASTDPARPIVVAGGGGTLRAAVEGAGGGTVHAAVEGAGGEGAAGTQHAAERAGADGDAPVFACLRMGSGNVVARALGVPRDPLLAAEAVGAALRRGTAVTATTLRVDSATCGSISGLAMCGLGEWGAVPGDILRWRESHPALRRRLAGAAGIERVNHVEYLAAGLRRVAGGMLPGVAEHATVRGAGIDYEGPLAALSVINTRIAGLPKAELLEPRARVVLLPASGAPRLGWLLEGEELTVSFSDHGRREFFLDEDPELAHDEVCIQLQRGPNFISCKEVLS